jgi:hypothetical protein
VKEIKGVSGVHVMAYRQEEYVAEIVHESGVLKGRTPWTARFPIRAMQGCRAAGCELTRRQAGKSSRKWPMSQRTAALKQIEYCAKARPAGHAFDNPFPAHDTDQAPTDLRGSDMTRTIVASATREIIIGFDQPFCVIGERINPTGRKKLAAEMIVGNFDTVIKDALEQVAAGATMLDVNAGVTSVNPNETEPALLVQTLQIVQGLVDVPLSIDSSVTAAIEAALKVAKGRPLVNSVTGEEEKLEAILPLCKKYDVPVVAISNDETGISMDPDVRFAVAKKIVERAMDYGIKPHDIVVDPLVMPIGASRRCRPPGLRAAVPSAQRTEGQHHLRPVEHLVRPAASPRHQCRFHPHGDRCRHDVGDHESLPSAGNGSRSRSQRA